VPRHEFICLPFQRSASGLEYQPLLLEQLRSSLSLPAFSTFIFLGDTFFQKKIFSKSRFVVTVGLQNATRYAIAEAFAKFAFSIVSAKRDALRDASSICNTRIACVALMGRGYASLSSSALSYSSPKESRTRKMMSQFLRTILLPTVQHLHDSGKSIPDYPSPPSSVPPFPKGWCFFVFL